ncbi:MAG TPA: hypothetical protein VFW84_10830 [Aquabacterium sp.]|uniref:hypothetical protein n=1 Tax=Aquabacterium sp. TaxID=1872578 RepID=UPI002D82580E|nr:hypothetical protein [Aquabacterium sp.]HET6786984.1 hypothetical protein [Aquabacterium sp.]HEX5373214.1 hypothetical protein [Aquabacterium sp.]
MKLVTVLKGGLVMAAVALITGCATQAPPYQASIDNVQVLQQKLSAKVRVGAFTVKPGAVGEKTIALRAVSMAAPNGDYGVYLGDAVKSELSLAKRLDQASPLELSGTLLGNDIDTAMGTASGYAEAQFVIAKDGQVRFSKVKRGQQSWESSFAGPVAIPKAQQQYPLIIQQLLSSLYSDPDFVNALK